MEMHEIQYFLAVCETRNFTRAAEACKVTQPALSRAIANLERQVGGQLFRRERTLTHLTDLGRLLRPNFEEVVARAEAAKRTATSFLNLERAPLRIGVMCTVGPLRFTGFLVDFRRQRPGLEMSLFEGNCGTLHQMLAGDKLDAAVLAQPDTYDEALEAIPLYCERFSVAIPPGHRFGEWRVVPLPAIASERYLERLNCEFATRFDDLLAARGLDVNVVFRSEREDWIQMMVLAGLGICLMPETLPVFPGVMTRPLCEPDVIRSVSLVVPADRPRSVALRHFIAAVREYPWPTCPPKSAASPLDQTIQRGG